MLYSEIFCWPNNRNRNELADEFFEKAASQFDNFPFATQDCALSLIQTSRGRMCHLFIAAKISVDDSVATTEAVNAFLMKCGCPKEQETESFNSWSLSLDEINDRFIEAGAGVSRRIDRSAGAGVVVRVGHPPLPFGSSKKHPLEDEWMQASWTRHNSGGNIDYKYGQLVYLPWFDRLAVSPPLYLLAQEELSAGECIEVRAQLDYGGVNLIKSEPRLFRNKTAEEAIQEAELRSL